MGLVRLPAGAALAVHELQIPLRANVMRLQQQCFPVGALGIGEMGVAIRAVRSRLEQREQSEIVEGAKSQLGIERGGRARQRRPRQRRIAGGQRGGARVVPRRVVVLVRFQLRQVRGRGRPDIALVPRAFGG